MCDWKAPGQLLNGRCSEIVLSTEWGFEHKALKQIYKDSKAKLSAWLNTIRAKYVKSTQLT